MLWHTRPARVRRYAPWARRGWPCAHSMPASRYYTSEDNATVVVVCYDVWYEISMPYQIACCTQDARTLSLRGQTEHTASRGVPRERSDARGLVRVCQSGSRLRHRNRHTGSGYIRQYRYLPPLMTYLVEVGIAYRIP